MRVIDASLQGKISNDAATRCLAAVESFLIRRTFAGYEPTGLHAIFKVLWAKCKGSVSKAVENMVSRTIFFPNDKEFGALVRGSSLYGRKLCSYVLAEYERGIESGDPYLGQGFDVDHLMPQKRAGAWKELVGKEEHEVLVNTWGNLVPISSSANKQKSNRSWPAVRDMLANESYPKTTRRLAADHQV